MDLPGPYMDGVNGINVHNAISVNPDEIIRQSRYNFQQWFSTCEFPAVRRMKRR